MLVFPTLFELLKDDHKIAFNKNILKFPALGESLLESLNKNHFMTYLTLNDCMNICALCEINYSFTYSTINDLFLNYKIVDDQIVYTD